MVGKTGPFERADRLLRPAEFGRVSRCGRRVQAGGFTFLVATREEPGAQPRPRLGVVVSRRVGNAVVRNRLKRRIREWFRHSRPLLRSDLDVVVVARRRAAGFSGEETRRALEEGARAVEGMT